MSHTITYSQHLLASDAQFAGRVASVLKDEGFSPVGEPGMDMAWQFLEDIASEPGLAESYHAALLGHVPEPGAADDVITDGVLLGAVTAVMTKAAGEGGA
jgi:hypothetical protein